MKDSAEEDDVSTSQSSHETETGYNKVIMTKEILVQPSKEETVVQPMNQQQNQNPGLSN